jgi:hypothetical protein
MTDSAASGPAGGPGDRHAFDAVIREGRGGGAYVEIPFDVKAVFGSGRPRIRATFDGRPRDAYRGSLAAMGGPRHVLGLVKAIRSEIGKGPGDAVRVEVWPDTEPREVVVPGDLDDAFRADPGARAAFDALSYTHRKEYVRWIEEAKRAETRERRVTETIRMVKAGETR